MSFDRIFVGSAISASGLSAERQRMELVASNIANAHSTGGVDGADPYRRREILFEAIANERLRGGNSPELRGVRVVGIREDASEFPRIYQPGHPHADAEGFVTMPNVSLPMEMVDLMTATRSYEANLKALLAYRQMLEQSLNLLRA